MLKFWMRNRGQAVAVINFFLVFSEKNFVRLFCPRKGRDREQIPWLFQSVALDAILRELWLLPCFRRVASEYPI